MLGKGEDPLFKDFEKLFPFPNLDGHNSGGHGSPSKIIDGVLVPENLFQERKLLKEIKNQYWKPVEKWLLDNGQNEVREKAIKAFKEDIFIIKRVPEELSYLFEGV